MLHLSVKPWPLTACRQEGVVDGLWVGGGSEET